VLVTGDDARVSVLNTLAGSVLVTIVYHYRCFVAIDRALLEIILKGKAEGAGDPSLARLRIRGDTGAAYAKVIIFLLRKESEKKRERMDLKKKEKTGRRAPDPSPRFDGT
jgi:hypothetical protein